MKSVYKLHFYESLIVSDERQKTLLSTFL